VCTKYHENSVLLGYAAAPLGNLFPVLSDNIIDSSSRAEMTKKMNNPCLKFHDKKLALSSKAEPPKNVLLGHFDS
jgi:hypothetical protein